jgi:hypothetical protein
VAFTFLPCLHGLLGGLSGEVSDKECCLVFWCECGMDLVRALVGAGDICQVVSWWGKVQVMPRSVSMGTFPVKPDSMEQHMLLSLVWGVGCGSLGAGTDHWCMPKSCERENHPPPGFARMELHKAHQEGKTSCPCVDQEVYGCQDPK